MSPDLKPDIGRLALRLTIGGLMLPHGVHKLTHGLGKIPETLMDRGLPGLIAYGVYVGEVVAPLCIMLGIFTRPAALVLAFNMVMAVYLVHLKDVLRLNAVGAWAIELQMLYLLGALSIALLGPGRLSIRR